MINTDHLIISEIKMNQIEEREICLRAVKDHGMTLSYLILYFQVSVSFWK